MNCPICKADIPNDSWYCDQCGEKLMFCPNCREPRKGKRCTQCGSLLVAGADLGNVAVGGGQQKTDGPGNPQRTATPPQDNAQQPGSVPPPPPANPQPSANTQPPRPTGNGFVPGAAPQQPGHSGTARGPSRPAQSQATQNVPPSEPTRLVMVDDPSRVVVLKDGAIIGRSTGDYVNVFGDQSYVSSRHAQIGWHSSNRWLIIDLNSTNGTCINNTPLEPNKKYLIKKGQIIEIGFVKFRAE